MSPVSHALTFEDLKRERDLRDERLELIEGEIVVTPSPTGLHQLVVLRLGALLNRVIVEAGLGLALPAPFDIVLDARSVLQPDLFILLRDRSRQMARAKVDGPPSLAIEVLSPSTGARDRTEKRHLYAHYGVPEYWLVDPETRTVTVFSEPEGGRYLKAETTADMAVSATIPTLSVDLPALFTPVPGF